eukprot:3971742-Pyramimonas_sp.AAC.1
MPLAERGRSCMSNLWTGRKWRSSLAQTSPRSRSNARWPARRRRSRSIPSIQTGVSVSIVRRACCLISGKSCWISRHSAMRCRRCAGRFATSRRWASTSKLCAQASLRPSLEARMTQGGVFSNLHVLWSGRQRST